MTIEVPTWDCSPPDDGEMPACEGLPEGHCIGTKGCIQVYHNACCSSCEPGGACENCISMQFHHCAVREEACGPSGPGCGEIVPEHCQCQPGSCGPLAGVMEPCDQVAGCFLAFSVESAPEQTAFCVPVYESMCHWPICQIVPPKCPEGLKIGSKGGCWAGFCVEPDLCPPPPMP